MLAVAVAGAGGAPGGKRRQRCPSPRSHPPRPVAHRGRPRKEQPRHGPTTPCPGAPREPAGAGDSSRAPGGGRSQPHADQASCLEGVCQSSPHPPAASGDERRPETAFLHRAAPHIRPPPARRGQQSPGAHCIPLPFSAIPSLTGHPSSSVLLPRGQRESRRARNAWHITAASPAITYRGFYQASIFGGFLPAAEMGREFSDTSGDKLRY